MSDRAEAAAVRARRFYPKSAGLQRAYKDGARARRAGKPMSSCPHEPRRSQSRSTWLHAWRAAWVAGWNSEAGGA